MNRSHIIWVLIIATTVYLGYTLIPMYYRYQMMILEVEGQIKVAHLYDEDELLEHIKAKVDEWELPVDHDTIIVDRRLDDIRITMNYHIDKNFLNVYQRRFRFTIRETGKIKSEF